MVSVYDNGIGIPASRVNEIYEPFHHLDSSSTRHSGSTGLGLALVRQIVSAHDSAIEVQPEGGKGTKFCFPLRAVLKGS